MDTKRLKKIVHRVIFPSHDPRPRWWIRNIVNPVFSKYGKNTIVRQNTRIDVVPFHAFTVGSNCIIEDFAIINNAIGDVRIGNDTIIGLSNTIIGPVMIGNEVMFAQNVVLSGMNHQYKDITIASRYQPCTTNPIIVEDEVWIGANVVVTAGITIGKHSVVAAGSVVTKDVPSYTVVAGNPAKPIKTFNPQTLSWEKAHNAVEIRK
ncbi:MAG: DapH/DapD/GlmU-related protein [Bacteroidota bacterium]|nr:DapH/DapD/GlmU-related protein [Bacteroidota bacterium]